MIQIPSSPIVFLIKRTIGGKRYFLTKLLTDLDTGITTFHWTDNILFAKAFTSENVAKEHHSIIGKQKSELKKITREEYRTLILTQQVMYYAKGNKNG